MKPDKPNGYKFETFIFDALRFTKHDPIALEIDRAGEYTPIKEFRGDNSVEEAWRAMREYWAGWLEAASHRVKRNATGNVAVNIEISPQFALSKEEFVEKAKGLVIPGDTDVCILPDGTLA